MHNSQELDDFYYWYPEVLEENVDSDMTDRDSECTDLVRPFYHDVLQGGEDWHRITNASLFRASSVATYMGVDPNRSRISIWREKKGLPGGARKISPFLQMKFDYGHKHEPDAREAIKRLFVSDDHELQIYNPHFYDVIDDDYIREQWGSKFERFIDKLGSFTHYDKPITVSPDMLAVDEWSPTEKFCPSFYNSITGGVEIKCPENQKITTAVPVPHMTQVQTMAEVIGVEDWMYFQWTPNCQKVFPVKRSVLAWERVIWPALERFARYLEGNQPPPSMSAREKVDICCKLASYCPETYSDIKSMHIDFTAVEF